MMAAQVVTGVRQAAEYAEGQGSTEEKLAKLYEDQLEALTAIRDYLNGTDLTNLGSTLAMLSGTMTSVQGAIVALSPSAIGTGISTLAASIEALRQAYLAENGQGASSRLYGTEDLAPANRLYPPEVAQARVLTAGSPASEAAGLAVITGKIATSSAAAAATANDVIMTPLRVQDLFAGQRPTAAEAAAGTSAVKIMTPAATEQHMVANALGWGQVRTALTSSQRPSGTVQTNDTGRPIEITVSIEGGGCRIETSADGTTFAVAARGININGEERLFASVTVPAGHRYRPNYGTFYSWSELR